MKRSGIVLVLLFLIFLCSCHGLGRTATAIEGKLTTYYYDESPSATDPSSLHIGHSAAETTISTTKALATKVSGDTENSSTTTKVSDDTELSSATTAISLDTETSTPAPDDTAETAVEERDLSAYLNYGSMETALAAYLQDRGIRAEQIGFIYQPATDTAHHFLGQAELLFPACGMEKLYLALEICDEIEAGQLDWQLVLTDPESAESGSLETFYRKMMLYDEQAPVDHLRRALALYLGQDPLLKIADWMDLHKERPEALSAGQIKAAVDTIYEAKRLYGSYAFTWQLLTENQMAVPTFGAYQAAVVRAESDSVCSEAGRVTSSREAYYYAILLRDVEAPATALCDLRTLVWLWHQRNYRA